MSTKQEGILYHYCGGEAFFNIIANSTLWLSDVLKSNDSQECIWIRDLVKARIETYLAETGSNEIKAWKTGYRLNDNIEDGGTAYAACFSESADSLSQWRGYAEDGSGIAIGFSKEKLNLLNDKFLYNLKLGKIMYQNQERFINRIVKENIGKMHNKGIGHVALELNQNYRLEFSLYKNPNFKEEREWRIVLLSTPTHKMNLEIEGIKFLEAKYRYSYGKIISYLEMNFSEVKREIIKEIWIGPKSKISPIDIRSMLSVYGYYGNMPYSIDEPIPIIRSASSYR